MHEAYSLQHQFIVLLTGFWYLAIIEKLRKVESLDLETVFWLILLLELQSVSISHQIISRIPRFSIT